MTTATSATGPRVPRRFRDILKRHRLVYELNARVKARRTARAITRLRQHYEARAMANGVAYSEADTLAQLHRRRAQRDIPAVPAARGGLRLFWVGANWNQDNAGFLAGLRKFGEVVCFRNAEGAYGLLYARDGAAIRLYDPAVVAENDRCLVEQVGQALKSGPLHLVAGQLWANFVSAEALQRIQHLGVLTANVAMDDRLPEHWTTYRNVRLGSIGLCAGVDLTLTSCADVCRWYAVEGARALFWPMASDPELFRPSAHKRFDVSFIGNKYGIRGKIVEALRHAGIGVDAFGAGWPNGSVGPERSGEIFSESRIILGVGNIGYNEDIYTLKIRDFDAPMAGALYITHRNPDLLRLFDEGREIECYASIEECVRKVRFYLNHPEDRSRVAAAGAARARRDHTWEVRIEKALTALELVEPSGGTATS